jgi:hypothetical protein
MSRLVGNSGPIDYEALQRIRDIVLEHEPLVSQVDLDERLDPRPELNVTVGEGFGSSPSGRFDIVWTERDCYSFHYTEPEGIDFRFDCHPEANAPPKHFHEPPGADTRVPSCIEVEQVEVATRAVLKCWRAALDRDDPTLVNTLSNPPYSDYCRSVPGRPPDEVLVSETNEGSEDSSSGVLASTASQGSSERRSDGVLANEVRQGSEDELGESSGRRSYR